MNKILDFLYKHLAFILFVVLELLAFLLVVNKNDLQRSVAFRYATTMSAWTYSVATSVTDYFGLAEANRLLAEENARLRSEMSDIESRFNFSDSICSDVDGDIEYISAKVVYNSVYDLQNYIIVDKGSEHGIEADMGVFAPQGVVGVVLRVSKNYSVVLPIINPDQIISAKIKSNEVLGPVVWKGKSPNYAKLEEIPNHTNVVAGDSVVTSGFSAIFPEGILIGTVDKVSLVEHTMFCDIDVSLAVDFQSLSYVTIASYKNKHELSDLQKTIGK
jgi:rod shape-determining protein MreC